MSASPSLLTVFSTEGIEPVRNSPFFAEILEGAPQTLSFRMTGGKETGTAAGAWEATPGIFRMDYQVWEFCHIISGICIIQPEGAAAVRLTAGDAFVCHKGLKGTWEIVETMRKHFVVNF